MRTVVSIILACLLAACSAGGCYENHSAIPLVEFWSADTDRAISLSGVNIGGVGAPGDSMLLAASESASDIYIPFRYNASELTFYIDYVDSETQMNTGRDLVTFTYDAIPYFAGEACGAMYNYRIRKVTHTNLALAEVQVLDSLITNIDVAYIRFKFHTESPQQP